MRRRQIILVSLFALVAAALFAAFAEDRDHHHEAKHHEAERHDMPRPVAPLLDDDDLPMDDVMPMHRAVRKALERFNGRVFEIVLTPPTPPERANGVQLVYQMRLLTADRDVIDIRVDAISGRFVEVRGSDIAAARRDPKQSKGE